MARYKMKIFYNGKLYDIKKVKVGEIYRITVNGRTHVITPPKRGDHVFITTHTTVVKIRRTAESNAYSDVELFPGERILGRCVQRASRFLAR